MIQHIDIYTHKETNKILQTKKLPFAVVLCGAKHIRWYTTAYLDDFDSEKEMCETCSLLRLQLQAEGRI